MAKPGVALKRPVGSKAEFKQNAELPKDLWKRGLPKAQPPPAAKAPAKPRAKLKTAKGGHAALATVLSFEKSKARRDQAHQKEKAKQEAARKKEHERIARAVAKAEDALERARDRHKSALADIARDRDKLDRREQAENAHWEVEQRRLEEARERATD